MTYLKSIWTGVDCRWGTWGLANDRGTYGIMPKQNLSIGAKSRWNYLKTNLCINYKLFLSIKINKYY